MTTKTEPEIVSQTENDIAKFDWGYIDADGVAHIDYCGECKWKVDESVAAVRAFHLGERRARLVVKELVKA